MADPTYAVTVREPAFLTVSSGAVNFGVNSSLIMNSGSPITVELWAHVAGAPAYESTAFTIGNNNICHAHLPWTDSVLYWDYGNSDVNSGRITATFSNYYNNWTHIALVSGGATNTYRAILLNGILVSSLAGSISPSVAQQGVWIGAAPAFSDGFYGAMADFRVWNYTRTPSEILADRFKRLTGTESGLIAYYPLDEATGATAHDVRSNYNATLVGSTWFWTDVESSWPIDVSSDVLHLSISRTMATLWESMREGRADIALDNSTRHYSPENSDSKYTGRFNPGRIIKITATHSTEQFGLFTGRIHSVAIKPTLQERAAIVELADDFARLRETTITSSLYQDYNPSSLFINLCSLASVAIGAVNSTPQDTVGFAWVDRRRVSDTFEDLLQFGNYAMYFDTNNKMVLLNRFYDQAESATTYNEYFDFTYDLDRELLVNHSNLSGRPRQFITTTSTLAWLTGAIEVPATAHRSFFLDFLDPENNEPNTPAQSFAALVSSADYYGAQNSDGTGSNFTTNMSVSVTYFATTAVATIYNSGVNPLYVTRFQLRGLPARRLPDLTFSDDVRSSQIRYGTKDFTLRNDMLHYEHARSYSQDILARFSSPPAKVTFALRNQWPDVVSRNLSDVVALGETQSGINQTYVITTIDHDVRLVSGLEHTTRYTTQVTSDQGYLILDSVTRGILDTNRLAP